MNTTLQTYQFSNLNLEVVEIDGMPWFIARPLAEFLGYKNPAEAIRDNVDSDDIATSYIPTKSANYILINESGLYSMILRSDKAEAKPFKKWVTSEVLPTIRKTGRYTAPQTLDHDRLHAQLSALQNHALRANPRWQKLVQYKKMGLNHVEIGRILRLNVSTIRRYVRQLEACGLLPYAKQLIVREV